MLRRLDVTARYRSLCAGFWPNDLPLGKRTVIYGHNGSGKSSFASLLHEIAERRTSTQVEWEDQAGEKTLIVPEGGAPDTHLAVFTKSWIADNLEGFLDGEASGSPIVTLGKEAIEAKDEEARLELEVADLRAQAAKAGQRASTVENQKQKLARGVQASITGQLNDVDHRQFTNSRFSINVVEGRLRDYKGKDFPSDAEHADALKRLGEGSAIAITSSSQPPTVRSDMIERAEQILTETPTRVAIAALEANSGWQRWVADGIRLHEHAGDCIFCGGEISTERRRELDRHFDESWFRLKEEAGSLKAQVGRDRSALESWLRALPAAAALASDLRDGYTIHAKAVEDGVSAQLSALSALEVALDVKLDDPSQVPDSPELGALQVGVPTSGLAEAISANNRQAKEHASVVAKHAETVINHLVGSQSQAFRDLEVQTKAEKDSAKALMDAAQISQRALDAVKQEQFSNSEMAATLTADLARVYGKRHLSVEMSSDGKSYVCRRDGANATHLSDGERTTLSLLYFLRKLEDETSVGDNGQRLIVIDDPTSSLDRETIYATHQWLYDTLKGIGQYVVLTHDFELLSLFLKSHKNAWGVSKKKIREGVDSEQGYPKVAFLEMYAAGSGASRETKVADLPYMLARETTEYAYLFSKVMEGIANPPDHDRIFLLPNAARRVLEVFASYKAPHVDGFIQRLECLMDEPDSNAHRDVYDFCNRGSHGEGRETVELMDARAAHRLISRCMEFLKSCDSQHFERMCVATETHASVVA